MKFNKWVPTPWYWSERKRQALIRKRQREAAAAPLFANEITEGQPCIADVVNERRLKWEQRERNDRSSRAAEWRRARAKLFSLPRPHRRVVRNWWNLHAWLNREPHYLASFIHSYVIHGRRPTREQLQKYGDAIMPVDFCLLSSGLTSNQVTDSKSGANLRVLETTNIPLF